jgi:hypothetical protein
MERENQTVYNKGSTSNKNRPAETRVSTTAGGNTYCSYKSKPRNHILLAAATVEVQNKLVTMYHAGPCETVDPNQASYQKDVYDV